MKIRHIRKAVILFCFLILAVVFTFFAFLKIRGSEFLLQHAYRPDLVFSNDMTLNEFAKSNGLEIPTIKDALGFASEEDGQKRLKDLNLSQEEIIRRVNHQLIARAKRENLLARLVNEAVRITFNNFGLVTKDIQRSGQPNPGVLWLHYKLFPFKSVINLAWQPQKSKTQAYEKIFCESRGIDYYRFSWNPGRPDDWEEVAQVMRILETCKKPVWIHCMGGKDRTGGLLALWKKDKGYPMDLIFRDFEIYRIPAFTWVQQLFLETKK